MINYKITIPRAKPKHFAENLETRLFPYRWCRGQYIIVMPDKNAVIAITSDNGDLQGELNLVWEHILPVL